MFNDNFKLNKKGKRIYFNNWLRERKINDNWDNMNYDEKLRYIRNTLISINYTIFIFLLLFAFYIYINLFK